MQPAHQLNQPTASRKPFTATCSRFISGQRRMRLQCHRFLQMVANDGGLKTAQKLLLRLLPQMAL